MGGYIFADMGNCCGGVERRQRRIYKARKELSFVGSVNAGETKACEAKNFTYEEVWRLIHEQMPLRGGADTSIVLSDKIYSTYSEKIINHFLEVQTLRANVYREERFDCDDFSVVLAGQARKWHATLRFSGATDGGTTLGIAHGRICGGGIAHAFNFWIGPEGRIIYIEPQTCRRLDLGVGAEIWFVYL